MRPRPLLLGAWAWLVLSALLFGLAGARACRERTSVWRQVQAREARSARDEAARIEALVASLEDVAEALARDLEGGLDRGGVEQRLETLLGAAPRVAVQLEVQVPRGPGRPWSAAAARDRSGVRPVRPDPAPLPDPAPVRHGWSEPYRSGLGSLNLIAFIRRFRPPGAGEASGLVRLEVSLEELNDRVSQMVPLAEGYTTLLSAGGAYLADPRDELVLAGETAAEVARELNDEGRKQMAAAALKGERAFVQGISGYSGQRVWIYLEPIPRNHWALALLLLQDDLPLRPAGWSRDVVVLTTAGILLALGILFLACQGHTLEARRLWWISIGGSLVLAGGIGVIFHETCTLPKPGSASETRILAPHALELFKARNASLQVRFSKVSADFLPTGVFIQTVELGGADLMKLTGQIWQKYPRGTPREDRGVLLPELISGSVSPGPEVELADGVLQLFSFQVVVRPELERNRLYPFDQTRIRLRLWPRRIFGNQILVPDLGAYTVLSPASLPGLDGEAELPGWQFTGSEFDYLTAAYNTNFGIPEFAGQRQSPELVYSISLQRNFLTPFIAAFLPLLAVAGLLFVLLLSVSRNPETMKATGYGFMNLLRTVIPLFFSLIVAQFNVRSRISGNGVLNLEWFYFVLYVVILAVSGLALRFSLGGGGILHAGDHRLPKLAFWPLLMGSFYLISLKFLV